MIKCKVDVEKEINEDGCNYMLHPEVDVKIIIEIFRKDFREDFLVNHKGGQISAENFPEKVAKISVKIAVDSRL
jgi:hypothetical protein